jgi:hypothetical protein
MQTTLRVLKGLLGLLASGKRAFVFLLKTRRVLAGGLSPGFPQEAKFR